MRPKEWMKRGAHTIFRNGHIYLAFLNKSKVYVTLVDKGVWTRYDDLEQVPWIDVSDQVFNPDSVSVQLVAAEILAAANECYCNTGVQLCDYCAGIRSLTDDELNKVTSKKVPITFFSEPNTRYALKKVESDTSQLIFDQEHGTILDKTLPKSYEYRVFEIDYNSGYIGLSGQCSSIDDVMEAYSVDLDVKSVLAKEAF